MHTVWRIAAVLAIVGCTVANARTMEAERGLRVEVLAAQHEDGFQARAAELRPRSLRPVLVSEPGAGPVTKTFPAVYGVKIDDDGTRSPKRHAARLVHTTAFETRMPEPIALLLLGTALCGASALCAYWASRMKRDEIAGAVSCSG